MDWKVMILLSVVFFSLPIITIGFDGRILVGLFCGVVSGKWLVFGMWGFMDEKEQSIKTIERVMS